MRKLSILFLAVGALWVGVAAGTGAWADGQSVSKTTISKHAVTAAGEQLDGHQQSASRSVPDHTNLVSVSWEGDPSATFHVETRDGTGAWVDRGTVSKADGGTDPGTPDARRAASVSEIVSEPILVKDPDEVRLRVGDGAASAVNVTAFASPTPDLPPAAAASMVPGFGLIGVGGAVVALRNRRRAVAVLVILVVAGGAISAIGVVGITKADAAAPGDIPFPAQPRIVTRSELGIDESLRLSVCPSGPDYAAPKLAIIHHTVNGNDYTQAGAADIVRNLYAYFINTRGYCDEAYNFLVDKYGTIYEGRYGGIDQGVVGAHATDFNTGTIGVSMIGDYSSVVPSSATVNAITDLLAWKFSIHNINPNAQVPTHGTTVNAIIGHRDAGAISGDTTDCPGNGGYSIVQTVLDQVRPRVAFGWPYGSLDLAQRTLTGARVAGWSVDPDVPSPIQVAIYLDGVGVTWTAANLSRPDIGAAFPGYGNNHGYDTVISVGPGTHTVCTYGISVANGGNKLLGCAPVTGHPIGSLDLARREGGPVHLSGWALDPASASSIPVHVYVDGVGAAITTANTTRTDVGTAYTGYGNNHGFDLAVTLANGSHTVCVYAISVSGGSNLQVGCRVVSGATVGDLDLARREGGPLHVTGWTLDLDRASSIPVHVYVDGVGAAILTANTTRSDIGNFFVGYGPDHGFDATVALAPGTHTVCAYGIGVGPTPNSGLGCAVVSGDPIGSLDAVTVSGGAMHVVGWAIDPTRVGSASVPIYVDGRGVAVVAAANSRSDVAAAFPGYGAAHGFDVPLPAVAGHHLVCAYVLATAPATNRVLGCRTT
jgi:N-acetylmuramoyl-L-alanine amidase